MKKIINLVTQMEAGGAQGAAIRMSKEMRSRGIDAETWFIYKKSDTYTGEENVVVIYDSPPSSIIHVIKIIFKTLKLLKKKKPEALVTYTHYANILGQISARLAGIKNRVATVRNPLWTYPKGARIADKIVGAIGFYTVIIAVSSTVKKSSAHYPGSYKKRVKVVYNGVPERISKLNKNEARNKFNLQVGSDALLINVGRLHPQKNQEFLIKLLPLLPSYQLAIAGDGELKHNLVNLARKLNVFEKVHFFGEINPNHIPDFLKAGDIFVFPSIYEAFGFAIFEAAYNNLPIIASNIPSNIEMLSMEDGGKAGVIVENMSEEKWVAAIKNITHEDSGKLIIDKMKYRLQQFNFDKMVNSYISYATEN